jgi:rubrerythrin
VAGILEKLKIKLAVNAGWKLPGIKAAAIRGFQATEADGVWHLHRTLARIDDPKIRAILFTHSLEEESHAEEFSYTYQLYTDQRIPAATYEREDLLKDGDPTWKALAFVHVGEEDATARFGLISDALGDEPLRNSLTKIVEDEEGHVDLTEKLLTWLGATKPEMKSEFRRVRIVRAWQAWLRSGKRVVDTVATGLLSASYLLLGPFVFVFARRRLQDRLVAYDNNNVKRLSA